MTDTPALSAVTREEIDAFFTSAFNKTDSRLKYLPETLALSEGHAVVRLQSRPSLLRPGGYISGPAQMGLADHAAYIAVFTKIGITPMALTSNLNINFLRPCLGAWLEADARILKFGRANVVIEVNIRGEQSDKVASHAIVTYVVPRDSKPGSQ